MRDKAGAPSAPPDQGLAEALEEALVSSQLIHQRLDRLSVLSHMRLNPREFLGAAQVAEAVAMALEGLSELLDAEADRWGV